MGQSIIMDDSEIMDIIFIGKWPKTKQNDDKRKIKMIIFVAAIRKTVK